VQVAIFLQRQKELYEENGKTVIKKNMRSFERWSIVLRWGIVAFAAIVTYAWLFDWLLKDRFSHLQIGLGLVATGVGYLLLLVSLFYLFRLSYMVESGDIFSRKAFLLTRKAWVFFLIWTVFAPFQRTLESLICTLHNPVGHRILFFAISSADIVRIIVLVALGFFVLALQRGSDIAEDQSLTI